MAELGVGLIKLGIADACPIANATKIAVAPLTTSITHPKISHLMFSSFSDSILSSIRWWVGWVAVGGTTVGLACTVLTIFITRETSARSSRKTSEIEAALSDTKDKLVIAEKNAEDAWKLSQKTHAASLERSLSEEQKAKLIGVLSTIPKGKIIVKSNLLDSETEAFAEQIKEALVSAGENVVDAGNVGIVSLHKSGGAIIVMSRDNPPSHAIPISEAFKSAGIDLPPMTFDHAKFDKDAIVVWISRK